jgi:glucokinase
MPHREVVAGLDLGGTKMLGVLVDQQGTIRTRLRQPTTMRGDAEVREGVLDFLRSLIEAGREAGLQTVGVGVGTPGYVDTMQGTIVDATNLAVVNLHLEPILQTTFSLPALVIHDVKAAALAEARLGAGAGTRYLAFLNVGTGIAAGLILDGQVYQGVGSRAGEIGHVVMEPNGPLCPCGLRGCLEMLAAGPAIARD